MVKVHVTVKVDEFLVLRYNLTRLNVSDSQMFVDVLEKLRPNVSPKCPPVDSACVGYDRLAAARRHGAMPLHSIKKNAREYERPETFYQKLVHFAHHRPRRFAARCAKLAHAETLFSIISTLLGYLSMMPFKKWSKKQGPVEVGAVHLIQMALRKALWS